jgi:hypothetical protein
LSVCLKFFLSNSPARSSSAKTAADIRNRLTQCKYTAAHLVCYSWNNKLTTTATTLPVYLHIR